MVERIVTGASYGLFSWLQQRVTAVIMLMIAVVFFVFIAYLGLNVNSNISSWQNVFHCNLVRIVAQLFFVALLLHAWVGIRDLWMDYVTCSRLRLTLHVLTIIWLAASLIYSIKIIWA
ncbi:MAG: succinate dehydrogenase / fumarate reductase, rane anchor subunit [Pseudomonadota bacterium]|nr:succinate dehydrogenase / fumarate reductase, rane anchor subunit [Pseudomonadota bacterium]